MRNLFILTFILLILFGGTAEAGFFEFFDGIVEKVKQVFGFKSLCEEPQIFRGGECCLDLNNDNECDEGLDSLTEEEINKFISEGGPGGCKGKECQGFCSNKKNKDECKLWCSENPILCEAFEDKREDEPRKVFFEKNQEIKKREIKESQKDVQGKENFKMKNLPCNTFEECKEYCEDHKNECGYEGSGKFENHMTKEEMVFCMEHPKECEEKFKDQKMEKQDNSRMYCKTEEECKRVYEKYQKNMPDCDPEKGCQEFSVERCEGVECERRNQGENYNPEQRDHMNYNDMEGYPEMRNGAEYRCDSEEECNKCMEEPESCRVSN